MDNSQTSIKILLETLSPAALRVLWAIKTKQSLKGIQNEELQELFHSGIMRQDYDVIGKQDVVLLSYRGKRCIELMENPNPPSPQPDPPTPPRPRKALVPFPHKRKKAA